MPQGQPLTVPDDGLTTRQRRNAAVLAVHTGVGKGKSTAAFGMALRAWNAGMDIGVFQFVKSAKWKVGEETVFERLGRLHAEEGIGGIERVFEPHDARLRAGDGVAQGLDGDGHEAQTFQKGQDAGASSSFSSSASSRCSEMDAPAISMEVT